MSVFPINKHFTVSSNWNILLNILLCLITIIYNSDIHVHERFSQSFCFYASDVQKKYSDLRHHSKAVHDKLQNALAARKVNDGDLRKLERWCKEAEMKCNEEPSLDCATELLQEQVKQYKVYILHILLCSTLF